MNLFEDYGEKKVSNIGKAPLKCVCESLCVRVCVRVFRLYALNFDKYVFVEHVSALRAGAG